MYLEDAPSGSGGARRGRAAISTRDSGGLGVREDALAKVGASELMYDFVVLRGLASCNSHATHRGALRSS